MSNKPNWGMINDGATFESLVAKIIYFEDSGAKLFGRLGKDAAQDMISGDGRIVYQAKYRSQNSMDKIIKISSDEFAKIKKYKSSDGYEKKAWDGVEKWIIISNFDVNKNDEIKWTGVKEQFKEIGIDAEYWTQKTLDGKISERPGLMQEYFQGKTRVFLTIPEVLQSLMLEEQCPGSYEIDILGRDKEIEMTGQFLASDKKILPVCGEGGVGKTKFLFDIGLKYAGEGWQVLWANTETMTSTSDWYYAINSHMKTILLIDEPENYNIITRVIEQFKLSHWKILIAFRSSKHHILDRLHKSRVKTIIETEIELEALDTDSAKQLTKILIDNAKLEILKPPEAVFIDSLTRNVGNLPIWIAIAIGVIKDTGSSVKIPESFREIAECYLDEVYETIDCCWCNKIELQNLLRWISLFDNFNIEETATIDFLTSLENMPNKLYFDRIFHVLKEKRLVKNWGINNRYYKIKPDVIKDYILSEWLLIKKEHDSKISEEAKKLVGIIISGYNGGAIPHLEEILQNIARIEYNRLPDNGILDSVFHSLDELVRKSNIAYYSSVIHLLSKFGFCNVEASLNIYKYILENPVPSKTIEDKFWGSNELSYSNIVREIPWALYNLSQHVDNDKTLISKILKILYEIFRNEIKQNVKNKMGKSAHELLPRMLAENRSSIFYNIVYDDACGYLDQILDDNLIELDMQLAKVIVSNLFRIERENTYCVGYTITWQKQLISTGGEDWKRIMLLIEKVKKIIESKKTNSERKIFAWNLLNEIHGNINRASLQEKKNNNYTQRLREWCKETLSWMKSLFDIKTPPMEEIKAARKIWNWHYRFDKDPEMQRIATNLENIYLADETTELFETLSSWDNHGVKQDEAAKEIAKGIQKNDSVESIISFVDQYSRFLDNDHGNMSHMVARFLSTELGHEGVVLTYVEKYLRGDIDNHFHFAVEIMKSFLSNLRINNPKSYGQYLLPFFKDMPSDNVIEALSKLYIDPRPFNNNYFTDDDFNLLTSQKDLFKQKYPLYFLLLGSLSYVDWDKSIDEINKCWDAVGDLELKGECLANLIRSVHLFFIVYKNQDKGKNEITANKILDTIFSLIPEVSDMRICLNYDLEYLVKMGYKRPLSWLKNTLNTRMKIEKKLGKNGSKFRAIPYDFNLSKWIQTPDDSKGYIAQLSVILNIIEKKSLVAYYLPEIIYSLDKAKNYIPDIVVSKLSVLAKKNEKDKFMTWCRFAEHLKSNSDEWRSIAIPACIYADTLNEEDKYDIYNAFTNRDTGVLTGMPGQVNEYWYDKLKELESNLISENETTLREYWQREVKITKADIEREEEWAETRDI